MYSIKLDKNTLQIIILILLRYITKYVNYSFCLNYNNLILKVLYLIIGMYFKKCKLFGNIDFIADFLYTVYYLLVYECLINIETFYNYILT